MRLGDWPFRRTTLLLAGLLAIGLGGCDSDDDAVPSADILAARHPADSHLDSLYETSCKACHANPQSGAPLVGMARPWRDRWGKGEDILLRHVLEGFNGMPAGGQCFSCSEADYRGLIRFLAKKD